MELHYFGGLTLEEAVAAFEELRQRGPLSLGSLGHAYGVSGRREEALQVLDDMIAQGAGLSYTAMVYTGLGETDRALDLLEQAVEERRVSLNIKVRRAYAPLRSEPRFQAVLEKMGLD